MELITIILSGFLSVFSNGGWIVDAIAKSRINSYLESAETIAVRVDNSPNYRLARGDVQKLRIASRGVYLRSDFRIASLELETDPIALDIANLDTGNIEELRESLQKPLQGAVSLTITERDLLNALQSKAIITQLQTALNNLVASRAGATTVSYSIIDPKIELSADNAIAIELTLRREGTTTITNRDRELAIAINLGFDLIEGKKIEVTTLEGTVNNRPISDRLLKGFAEGISDRLDLTTIEKQGIFVRLLQLEIAEDRINTIAFARLETKSR